MGDTAEIMRGMEVWENPQNGFTVLKIHYTADKYKDPNRVVCEDCGYHRDIRGSTGQKCPECKGKLVDFGKKWAKKTLDVLSHADRQQEYEINWEASHGKRVFPPFRRERHVGVCHVAPRSVMIRGWDFGKHHPAVVICHDNTMVNSFQVIECFLGYDIDFLIFCDTVVAYCNRKWPRMGWMEGVDPQGSWRSSQGGMMDRDTQSETPVDYMRNKHNLDVDWQNIDPSDVQDKLRKCMSENPVNAESLEPFMIQETPATRIYSKHPNIQIRSGTQTLIDGLTGHCIFGKHSDGTYSDKMVKTIHSHPADGLGYAYIRARKEKETAEEESAVHQLLARRGAVKPGLDGMGGPNF